MLFLKSEFLRLIVVAVVVGDGGGFDGVVVVVVALVRCCCLLLWWLLPLSLLFSRYESRCRSAIHGMGGLYTPLPPQKAGPKERVLLRYTAWEGALPALAQRTTCAIYYKRGTPFIAKTIPD